MLTHKLIKESLLLAFSVFVTSCQHKKSEGLSTWQVVYHGNGASVNYANQSGESYQKKVTNLATCAAADPGKVRCVSKDGMAAEFSTQSSAATLFGKSEDTTAIGVINLACRVPFVEGQPVVCDQTANP